jgi:hypothetical protein
MFVRVLASRAGSRIARFAPAMTFRTLHSWPTGVEKRNSSVFVLSFDCETDRDVKVLPLLLQQLQGAGITASFAVIGALAEKYPEQHRDLVRGGHEVLNHGYSEHTSISADGSYDSTLFYNELTRERMRDEIIRGGAAIEAACDVAPVGFRAPHFGTLGVAAGDVGRLHDVLRETGAQYSSSVTDLDALRLGGGSDDQTIPEFPLASHPDQPRGVLDSWSTVEAFGEDYVPGSLLDPIDRILRRLAGSGGSRFGSVYLDPVQVVELPEFVECLRLVAQVQSTVSVLRYCDLLQNTD